LMATTVRLSEKTNAKLDRLQAKIVLKAGRKLSKEQILDRLIEEGLRKDDWIAFHGARVRYPVPDRAWKKVLSHIRDWGVETREEDVDRYVYGGRD